MIRHPDFYIQALFCEFLPCIETRGHINIRTPDFWPDINARSPQAPESVVSVPVETNSLQFRWYSPFILLISQLINHVEFFATRWVCPEGTVKRVHTLYYSTRTKSEFYPRFWILKFEEKETLLWYLYLAAQISKISTCKHLNIYVFGLLATCQFTLWTESISSNGDKAWHHRASLLSLFSSWISCDTCVSVHLKTTKLTFKYV